MPIHSRPDHVAVAVPDIDAAFARWRDTLGGVVMWRFHTPAVFRGAAMRFHGGAYLELLQPSEAEERVRESGGPAGFVDAFLDRYGPRVHHVTLKVPDIRAALDTLATDGFDVVDVHLDDPHWREAFLRPSQVGGIVVQVAETDLTNEQWAARHDHEMPATPTDGPRLLGPLLTHTDLDDAARVWTALGAEVEVDGDELLASWPDEPLTVAIRAGDRVDAIGLRYAGAAPRPVDAELGPPVLGTPA